MRSLLLLTCLGWLGLSASPALGQNPAAKDLLAKANQAAKPIKMVSYRAEAWVEGALVDKFPRFRATVSMKEGDLGAPPLVRFEGTINAPGSSGPAAFLIVVDGKRVLTVDEANRICTVGDLPEAIDLLVQPLQMLFVQEFVHASPYREEFNAASVSYEGKKTVSGTMCHVINVNYGDRRGQANWYLGVNDYLPYRVDQVVNDPQSTGKRVLELSNINTQPDFDENTFATRAREGYEQKKYTRPLRSDPRLLPVGNPAPDWTLKTSDGKSVSLSSLRGKVVVLDFWATWCIPCIQAMPGVQKLHEHFKDKPVAVFGINVGERTWNADPAGFMKQKGYDYGLLLNGGKVAQAYRVIGIPTFYVIAPDGAVLHASAGYDPTAEGAFVRLIESALKDRADNGSEQE